MDILQMGSSMLSEKLGTDVDAESISSALSGLLAGPDGNLDLAGLVSRFAANADFGDLLGSWLGDGANAALSPDGLMSILGGDKVAGFAEQLGVDASDAAGSLAEVLPEMLDKASSGGSLLDMAGGAEGLLGAAKSFFS
ncbi:MAG: YidB family protein [Halieaceae bacterium]|nr:YidB family protein [Halieaceae bacterium]